MSHPFTAVSFSRFLEVKSVDKICNKKAYYFVLKKNKQEMQL